ncbi:MAG: hypothetical protein GWO08_09690, partial [Gammaproteobacteria bacterium]|nr:hypothetical protein [Gammaproteobacteria bacterium]NIR93930.1 hypothetical protein [Gammaproteobacteria bacterium]
MPYDITQDQWDNDDIEILWRMDKELIRKGVAYAPTKDSDVWADGDDVMGLIDVGPQHFDLVPTTAAKYKDTGGPSAGDIYLAFDGSTSSRYYT